MTSELPRLPPFGSETPQEKWQRIYSVTDYQASMKTMGKTAFAVGFAFGFLSGVLFLATAFVISMVAE